MYYYYYYYYCKYRSSAKQQKNYRRHMSVFVNKKNKIKGSRFYTCGEYRKVKIWRIFHMLLKYPIYIKIDNLKKIIWYKIIFLHKAKFWKRRYFYQMICSISNPCKKNVYRKQFILWNRNVYILRHAILLINSKKSVKKMLDINLFCKYNQKNIFVFKSTYLASFLYVSLVGDVDSRLLEPAWPTFARPFSLRSEDFLLSLRTFFFFFLLEFSPFTHRTALRVGK